MNPLGSLSFDQRNRVLRSLRRAARRSGVTTARTEMRVAWVALTAYSMTGGPNGGKRSVPLHVSSETVARHVIEELGPRWGLSADSADRALGELRDDGLLNWPSPAPILETLDNGASACVGREVREVFLTEGAWAIARDALGMLNPQICGVTETSDAAAPAPGGAQAASRRGTTNAAGPPGSIAALFATLKLRAPF